MDKRGRNDTGYTEMGGSIAFPGGWFERLRLITGAQGIRDGMNSSEEFSAERNEPAERSEIRRQHE